MALVFRSFVVSALALAAPLAAQSLRLNGPLAQPGAGGVAWSGTDAVSQRVAYQAVQNEDGVVELFSAPLDGSAPPIRLGGPVPWYGQALAIAAGSRVLYLSDESAEGVYELFSVPIDGSASGVSISGPLVAGGDVEVFELTPDRTRAVFRATKVASTRPELFVVPVDGSAAPVRLDPLDRSVTNFWITPDGASAVYAVPSSVQELLYRVPLNASQLPLQLAVSEPAPAGSPASWFLQLEFDLDGTHAVYETQLHLLGQGWKRDLFAVALDASAPAVQLNVPGPLGFGFEIAIAGERVVYATTNELYSIEIDGTDRRLLGDDVSGFVVTPDGTRVAFPSSGTLHSAPIDGSQPAVAIAPSDLEVLDIEVSPDSTRVVFQGVDSHSFRGLWVVPITGAAPTVLLNRPRLSGVRGVNRFAITPDGQRVVYSEDREEDDLFELYSVDASLVPVKLNDPLAGELRDVIDFQISADGQRVVYRADQAADQVFELFGAPIDGSLPSVRYNEAFPAGPVLGDVVSYRAASESATVVYLADQDDDEVFDLYTVNEGTPGESVRVSAGLTDPGDATGLFAVSPTDGRVVLEIEREDSFDLYSVPADGGTPVEIDSTGSRYRPFAAPLVFTPDGSFVVYRRSSLATGDYDLCSAPVDGGPVVTLASPADARTVTGFRLSPDGSTVVYRADQAHTSLFEIYRVPVDGSAAPQRLNLPLSGERDVDEFRITPDGAHVVYLADQTLNDHVELWSVPLSGGQPPERLNGVLPSFGDVTDFRISGDGRWVVFRANPDFATTFDLFRARVAGRRPPVVGPQGVLPDLVFLARLPQNRTVKTDFAIAPDGLAVFFRADAAADDVIELFRVPGDGSARPVKVSADPVAGGDVSAFAVAPDSSRVVYLADARVDGVTEIFSIPALGGAALALDTLPAFADVASFRIAPDSAHVGWLADRNTDEAFDLFLAPLDGSQAARRVNALLPAGGDVDEDYTILSGGRALYRADREANEVFELFLGFFEPGARTVDVPAPVRVRTHRP